MLFSALALASALVGSAHGALAPATADSEHAYKSVGPFQLVGHAAGNTVADHRHLWRSADAASRATERREQHASAHAEKRAEALNRFNVLQFGETPDDVFSRTEGEWSTADAATFNERDWLFTYASMLEQTYPEDDRDTSRYREPEREDGDAESEHRQAVYASNTADLDDFGFDVEKLFYGDEADADTASDSQVGVQAYVYANNATKDTVIAFRGSYSTADYVVNYRWWADDTNNVMSDRTKDVWVSEGNDEDDLENGASFADYYYRFVLDAVVNFSWGGYRWTLAEETGFDEDELDERAYYAVALQLFDDVQELIPDDHEIHIIGHSLGGALAQLVSMRQATLGNVYKTVALAPPGVDCLSQREWADDFLPDDHVYGNIRAYVATFDWIPYLDRQPGNECFISPDDEATEKSQSVLGLGTGYWFGTNSDGATDQRVYTHSIYHFWAVFKALPAVDANGQTDGGCARAVQRECAADDSGNTYRAVIFFTFLFTFWLLVALIGLPIFACTKCAAFGGCGASLPLVVRILVFTPVVFLFGPFALFLVVYRARSATRVQDVPSKSDIESQSTPAPADSASGTVSSASVSASNSVSTSASHSLPSATYSGDSTTSSSS